MVANTVFLSDLIREFEVNNAIKHAFYRMGQSQATGRLVCCSEESASQLWKHLVEKYLVEQKGLQIHFSDLDSQARFAKEFGHKLKFDSETEREREKVYDAHSKGGQYDTHKFVLFKIIDEAREAHRQHAENLHLSGF